MIKILSLLVAFMFRTVASRRFYVFSARPFGADREVSYEFLIHKIVSQIGKYGFYFFQNQGMSSISFRLSLNMILEKSRCREPEWKLIKMAEEMEKIEVNAEIFTSLLRRLYSERHRLRRY